MRNIVQWLNKRTINQKIAIVAILTSSLTTIIVSLLAKTLITFNLNLQINNIVRQTVQKEIANIREAIHQHYSAFKTEYFTKADLGKKIFVNPNPFNPQKDSVIFFVLESVPEYNSIQIISNSGLLAPAGSYEIDSNIVRARVSSRSSNEVFAENRAYIVKYIPNVLSSEEKHLFKSIETTAENGQYKTTLKE